MDNTSLPNDSPTTDDLRYLGDAEHEGVFDQLGIVQGRENTDCNHHDFLVVPGWGSLDVDDEPELEDDPDEQRFRLNDLRDRLDFFEHAHCQFKEEMFEKLHRLRLVADEVDEASWKGDEGLEDLDRAIDSLDRLVKDIEATFVYFVELFSNEDY